MKDTSDLRLIEAGFPCHQVGAETQRERGASSALPPLYFLHVWWARRPLTPSRAAILGSLLPADTDPDWFLRQLGIEKKVVEINGQEWVLTGKIFAKVTGNTLYFDSVALELLQKENKRREKCRAIINKLKRQNRELSSHPVLLSWEKDVAVITPPFPTCFSELSIKTIAADPAQVNERIAFAKLPEVVSILGEAIKWDPEDLYGYARAFTTNPTKDNKPKVILDPTAGGGSIPFEALRLGHNVIANELNPVASVILNATLDYPARYGVDLLENISEWGEKLVDKVSSKMDEVTPFSDLPLDEKHHLKKHCEKCPEVVPLFDIPEYDQTGLLYCRQVTCPHCHGEAPLLNTSWLSKEAGNQWGLSIITDGKTKNGTVQFKTYRASKGKGPNGEDPNFATVNRGVGYCVHCKQAIDAEEIKRQARGESELGKWNDRLYCVVAVRFQPKLDKQGKPVRYKSGEKAGQIKTEKVRFFRTPNSRDLEALRLAEKQLQENWEKWDRAGLIPTEEIKEGYNTKQPLSFGMTRWFEMFTQRQLLGHLTITDELIKLKPEILNTLGEEKGKAVITYLQFMIDKNLDYNSKQTRWENTRCIVKGTFSNHNFGPKWTFGEMIFSGPNSGARWGLSQILDAYKGISELAPNSYPDNKSVQVINGTAAHMPQIESNTVDLICMDPPYYNNVQYAELSDYFYVWQKRTLSDLYPQFFERRLTNKQDEAVANSVRSGNNESAFKKYENLMRDIFYECGRVLKSDGIMTLMFTHKSQDAWSTITTALIESGWEIKSSFPVDSESIISTQLMNKASAVSSIFISCRKKLDKKTEPSIWSSFGGGGVQSQIVEAVREGLKEFRSLKLGPVDEMVASYGRALRVLSENWPVIDGDEMVGPSRAMNEASRVVAENQIEKITQGRLHVEDLSPETAMALTLFGIYGLGEIPYDDALNLSRSLSIQLTSFSGGYQLNGGRFIGINNDSGSGRRAAGTSAHEIGFYAPLVKKGSKLRLAKPGERNKSRINNPKTEWDLLHGTILAYREGDIVLAKDYLSRKASEKSDLIIDLINVWASAMTDETLRKEAKALLFSLK